MAQNVAQEKQPPARAPFSAEERSLRDRNQELVERKSQLRSELDSLRAEVRMIAETLKGSQGVNVAERRKLRARRQEIGERPKTLAQEMSAVLAEKKQVMEQLRAFKK